MPLAGLVIAYLAGSIPFAYLAGKLFKGIDLREHGSGNLGATNVFRVMGWKIASAGDGARHGEGCAARAPASAAVRAGASPELWAIAFGVAAIVGHVRSVFLLWKGGGKGVATAGGVFLALAPIASLISIAVFALVVYLSGYVSLASLCERGGAHDRRRDHRQARAHRSRSRARVITRVRVLDAPRQHRAAAARRGESLPPGEAGHLMRCAVVGAGAWGTALADLLARNGHEVALWAREPEVVASVNAQHENTIFLAGATLHDGVVAHGRARARVHGRGARALRDAIARAARDRARRGAGRARSTPRSWSRPRASSATRSR